MKKRKLHSLETIVIASVGVCMILFAIVFLSISYTTMAKIIHWSEDEYISEQIHSIEGLLENAKEDHQNSILNLALWSETVNYVQGSNPDYMDIHWSDMPILETYPFNFVVFKNLQGETVYAEYYNLITKEPISAPEHFVDTLSLYHQDILDHFIQQTTSDKNDIGKSGIFYHEGEAYYMWGVPILENVSSTEPAGTLFLGSHLSNEYFQHITHNSSMTFSVMDLQEIEERKESIHYADNNTVHMTIPFSGMDDQEYFIDVVALRSIYSRGKNTLYLGIALLGLTIVLMIAVLYQVIMRFAIYPIKTLSEDLRQINPSEYLEPGKYSNNMEFTMLSQSVNDMISRLNKASLSLEDTKNVFNGLDAFVYVSDPETNKIILTNDKIEHYLGLKNDPVGKKCWEGLGKSISAKCENCPLQNILDNPEKKDITTEEYNPLTECWHRCTDTLIQWSDNRVVHLHHRVDITELKHIQHQMEEQMAYQKLMLDLSRHFTSAESTNIQIQKVLQMAGEFTGVDRIVLARINAEKGELHFVRQWQKNKSSQLDSDSFFSFQKESEIFYHQLVEQKQQHIIVDDISSSSYKSLAQFGLTSFVMTPITINGVFWGVVSLDYCEQIKKWNETEINLGSFLSDVLSGALARDIAENNLLKMSSIVNSSPQYVTLLNNKQQFEYVNPGTTRITGYSEKELKDYGMSLFFDEKTYKNLIDNIVPKVAEERRINFELPIHCKDGSEKIINFSVFSIDDDNLYQGAIGSDVTEKKYIEKELLEAKERAEQSNYAKSDFLSRMSHEMRTPMNAIIGMTSIAQGSQNIDKKDYCLEKIDEASKHLLGVINDILDMSKIEAGKFELNYSEFNFEKMLARVANVVTFKIDEKQLEFLISIDENVPQNIFGDEQRLAQVITNLLSNAIKFTPENGTIRLHVSLLEEADGICTLKMQVQDNGIGISKENQTKLFRSFEQADGGISRRFGGTGLGLAISKKIVNMMEGDIWVESEYDQGSTFIFTIKAKRGIHVIREGLSSHTTWDNLGIMIVDDSADVREYFASFAAANNIFCQEASSGKEALQLINKTSDDRMHVIFVDWMMPGMDGIALARKIREILGEDTVVIMISAAEMNDVRQNAEGIGINRFLQKPIFSSLIVDAINECIGITKASAPTNYKSASYTGAFQHCRLLLAEDIEINRIIVHAILEDTGIVIENAENGLEAYQMFAEHPDSYDIVFMDIHMPEMDGLEATRKIRKLDLQEAKTVPIIALTANVFREDIEKCLAAGMNGHIGKPIDVDEMYKVLNEYLQDSTT